MATIPLPLKGRAESPKAREKPMPTKKAGTAEEYGFIPVFFARSLNSSRKMTKTAILCERSAARNPAIRK